MSPTCPATGLKALNDNKCLSTRLQCTQKPIAFNIGGGGNSTHNAQDLLPVASGQASLVANAPQSCMGEKHVSRLKSTSFAFVKVLPRSHPSAPGALLWLGSPRCWLRAPQSPARRTDPVAHFFLTEKTVMYVLRHSYYIRISALHTYL